MSDISTALLRVPVVDPKTGIVSRQWRLVLSAIVAGVNTNTGTLESQVGAAPSAKVGLSAVAGSASSFIRSDGAPALDQTIAPTWTATHTFSNAVPFALANASALQANAPGGGGVTWFTFNASSVQRFGDYGNAYAAELSGTTVTLRYGAAVAGLTLSASGVACTVPIKTPSYVVSALPSASTAGAGARALVTDANATTFLSTVAGGGSNIVPVVSNGTNWVIG